MKADASFETDRERRQDSRDDHQQYCIYDWLLSGDPRQQRSFRILVQHRGRHCPIRPKPIGPPSGRPSKPRRSTASTSLLTDASLIGQMKTRATAAWAERRGFSATIYERTFDSSFKRQDGEPAIALCGIDNGLGRRALDQVGFKYVVEAGLGRSYQEFRSIRLHTLPGARPAAELWKASEATSAFADRSAYQQLLGEGILDRCGVTVLAGKAVGAPFVGSVAATLVLSEILRLLHRGPPHEVIEMDLAGIGHRAVVVRDADSMDFNPGFVEPDQTSVRQVASVDCRERRRTQGAHVLPALPPQVTESYRAGRGRNRSP